MESSVCQRFSTETMLQPSQNGRTEDTNGTVGTGNSFTPNERSLYPPISLSVSNPPLRFYSYLILNIPNLLETDLVEAKRIRKCREASVFANLVAQLKVRFCPTLPL